MEFFLTVVEGGGIDFTRHSLCSILNVLIVEHPGDGGLIHSKGTRNMDCIDSNTTTTSTSCLWVWAVMGEAREQYGESISSRSRLRLPVITIEMIQ